MSDILCKCRMHFYTSNRILYIHYLVWGRAKQTESSVCLHNANSTNTHPTHAAALCLLRVYVFTCVLVWCVCILCVYVKPNYLLHFFNSTDFT